MQVDKAYYKSIVEHWTSKKIIILGDSMLDSYIFGKVRRISPEAPVPVVESKRELVHLGGACNVAKNIKALGGEPHIFSFIGDDTYGDVLSSLLEEEGVCSHLYRVKGIPTTVKTRVIADTQHIVRIDKEEVRNLCSEGIDWIVNELKQVISEEDIIIYSDYAKGFFSYDMVSKVDALLKEMKIRPRILVDPKVSNINLFQGVYLVTPNSKETEESTGILIDTEEGLQKAASHLFTLCQCEYVLTTLGAKGMALFSALGDMQYIAGIEQEVSDVTGAGDAVIATIAFALANGVSLSDAVLLSNYSGSYSVCHMGVVSVSGNDIIEMIERSSL